MHSLVATTAGLYIVCEAKALYDLSTAGDGFSSSYPLLYWAEEAVSRTPVKLLFAIAKTGDALMEVKQFYNITNRLNPFLIDGVFFIL